MIKQVLICGAARSGSTLLDMLLGRHPRVESLGEIDLLGKAIARNEACSCGDAVRTCPAWIPIFRSIQKERGIDLLRDPYGMWIWDTRIKNANADLDQQNQAYLFRCALRQVLTLVHYSSSMCARIPLPPTLRRGTNNALYLYEVVRRMRAVDIVVDSSKNVYKALSVYLADPESTRIVLLIRDGRGVMFSRLYSGLRTGESPSYAIEQWRRYYARSLVLLRRWVKPMDVKYLHYEELGARGDETVKALWRWIGVPSEGSGITNSGKELHIAGGNDGTKSRFNAGIRLDERWRDGLSPQELDLFAQKAGQLNRQLGYA